MTRYESISKPPESYDDDGFEALTAAELRAIIHSEGYILARNVYEDQPAGRRWVLLDNDGYLPSESRG